MEHGHFTLYLVKHILWEYGTLGEKNGILTISLQVLVMPLHNDFSNIFETKFLFHVI